MKLSTFLIIQAMAASIKLAFTFVSGVSDDQYLEEFEAIGGDCQAPPKKYWILEEESPTSAPFPDRERTPTTPESGGGIGGDTDSPTKGPTPAPTKKPTWGPTFSPTKAPTTNSPTNSASEPDAVEILEFTRNPEDCGSLALQQFDYRGTISTTRSGRTCQRWDDRTVHEHTRTPERYPASDLIENYCRNPDGESHAWCYTTDPNKRWEMCDVPACEPDDCGDNGGDNTSEGDGCVVIGGGRWSGVFGDPHLSTFDRFTFDCQAAGVFTTLTSVQTPAFKMQEIFTPIGSGHCSQASVSTAIAIQDEGLPKIQISTPRNEAGLPNAVGTCPIDFRMNGALRDIAAGTGREDVLVAASSEFIVIRYTMTRLFVRIAVRNSPSFGCHFLIEVFLPNSYRRQETLIGLLGKPDDNARNDWTDRNGNELTSPINAHAAAFQPAYDYCTTNWCESDESGSIFDFRPSESFDAANGCDHPYDNGVESAIEMASQNLINACGGGDNVPCLIDGVCGGVEDAVLQVQDEEDIEEEDEVSELLSEVCGSMSIGQVNYRGNIAVTEGGLNCQRWDQQTPHEHVFSPGLFPRAGLGGNSNNFCRNPDGDTRAWCYTDSASVRWQYCNIPDCDLEAQVGNDEEETEVSAQNMEEDCGEVTLLMRDYRGDLSTTVDGIECQDWDAQTPHTHSFTSQNFPLDGLANTNACRNPDNDPNGGWCYTSDANQRWQYCDIPKCCGNGASRADYRGRLAVTTSNDDCQAWEANFPHAHTFKSTAYPDAGLNDGPGNYCRNPDSDNNGPWCFTQNTESRWQYCNVERCDT